MTLMAIRWRSRKACRRDCKVNSPNTLNAAVLTETLSVRMPLDFIKTLIAAASAKNVTLSHHVRHILEKSTGAKSGA